MRIKIETGPFTGLPIVAITPDPSEVAAFSAQLLKEGVADMDDETAAACMSVLHRFLPAQAAILTAKVILAAEVPSERYFGAALAARAVCEAI